MKKYYANLKLFLFFILIGGVSLSATISTPYGDKIEAVIFDCDGVLVDTEYLKFLAWQEALANQNISFTIEEYMPLVGHSSKNILLMLKKLKSMDIPEEVITLKNAKYRILQKQGVPPINEMIRFAKRFAEERRNLGIKLGLASSAPTEEILQNLEQIGLENSFDLIISGSDDLDHYIDDEGTNKPKPYIYIEAAKRLKVSPSKCLVFEDTTAGIEAATAAGMIAIAVPNQFTVGQDFSKAVIVINSYKDLPLKEIFKTRKHIRFILALIPHKQTVSTYIHAAQMLFLPAQDGYLLSNRSSPHITVGQFECDNEQDAVAIWKQIEKLNILPFSPRFTGLSFVKGVGAHKEYYWAELAVARDPEIMRVHQLMAKIIRSKGFSCLNDSDNLYRPHLTLARIRLPDTIQRWPDTLLTNASDFRLSLAHGDNNGQYLYTLFESSED